MAVESRSMLTYAEQQLTLVTCEVGVRNVIGRAYYACFHRINDFHDSLPSPGEQPAFVDGRQKGSHARLIHALQHPTVDDDSLAKISRQLGRIGKGLHEKRCAADYELNDTIDKRIAMQTVAEVKRLFTLLDRGNSD